MGLFRFLNQWREKKDGTLEGPALSTDDTTTKRISDDRHFAGDYDGATANDRLSAAITEADAGDVIFLEKATYNSLTLNKEVGLVFEDNSFGTAPKIASGETWTIASESGLQGVDISGSVVLSANQIDAENVTVRGSATLTVDGNGCLISHVHGGGSVEFNSGTTNGEIGIVSGTVSVTDNGTNNTL
ncbi:hypothetical protein [Haloarcula argentinensis]|uniref:DUF1565 domain-containing protein n=1 Tax=Haloarcula argentinensis TaxID=43776 RepID=A0A847U0W7_HALAR|nr:hypothetical protein [Haloarcula argentinensis]NLV11882.1 hypothetical protein [Haloarcula argentinensis]